jgi:hypothetical protein
MTGVIAVDPIRIAVSSHCCGTDQQTLLRGSPDHGRAVAGQRTLNLVLELKLSCGKPGI